MCFFLPLIRSIVETPQPCRLAFQPSQRSSSAPQGPTTNGHTFSHGSPTSEPRLLVQSALHRVRKSREECSELTPRTHIVCGPGGGRGVGRLIRPRSFIPEPLAGAPPCPWDSPKPPFSQLKHDPSTHIISNMSGLGQGLAVYPSVLIH
jgi:hypothetical protein